MDPSLQLWEFPYLVNVECCGNSLICLSMDIQHCEPWQSILVDQYQYIHMKEQISHQMIAFGISSLNHSLCLRSRLSSNLHILDHVLHRRTKVWASEALLYYITASFYGMFWLSTTFIFDSSLVVWLTLVIRTPTPCLFLLGLKCLNLNTWFRDRLQIWKLDN